MEGDALGIYTSKAADYFNPRPPCGGRPTFLDQLDLLQGISIHALRVEGDQDDGIPF